MSLNVFSKHYCSYRGLGFKKRIREPFLRLKWAYQRITRGYSDFDCYDLTQFYGELIGESLAHFSANIHSFPINDHYSTFETWQEALSSAADDFKIIKQYEVDNGKVQSYIKRKVMFDEPLDVKIWMRHDEEDNEIRSAAMERAFSFLKENWFDLWD
jgi:hypothetical protein